MPNVKHSSQDIGQARHRGFLRDWLHQTQYLKTLEVFKMTTADYQENFFYLYFPLIEVFYEKTSEKKIQWEI